MPKMHIDKSIEINAPSDKVFTTISDFHHWRPWSPWLVAEPEARVDIREDGKYYEWEGARTGAGNMTVLKESQNQSIDIDLTFLKPWKSTAKVYFKCEEQDGKTKVHWLMDSSLPFFMFWMKKSMTAFIGMDYERGLSMLKEYVETGKVRSQLNFKGYEDYPGCKFVGLKTETLLADLGPKMSADLQTLGEFFADKKDVVAGKPFSIYHKWDMVNRKASYTSGIPVIEIPNDLPAGMISGEIPKTKVYTLQHVGPYQHLGNAWSTINVMARNKEIKAVGGIHPFETYVNMPGEVADEELITEIHFAVK